jgi:hypothetical protein
MYNATSSPSLSDVSFDGNQSLAGGGIYNGNSRPSLTGVRFSGNWAVAGGGMINRAASGPNLTNVIFSGNRAGQGAGMYNGNSNPTLTNVTLSGNQAPLQGGGLYNENGSVALLQNVIIWDNSATTGPSIFNTSASTTTVRYSTVQGGISTGSVDEGNNLLTAPQFVAAATCGDDGLCADDPSTLTVDESADDDYGDLRLRPGSPAIDAGDNGADLDGTAPLTTTIADLPTDLTDGPRRVAVRSATLTVDMGAYEAPNSPPAFISSPAPIAPAEVTYTYNISATDPNQPDGAGLVLSTLTVPGWLTLDDQGSGAGTLSGAPHTVGVDAVALQVADGAGLTATQTFSITVIAGDGSGRLLLPLIDH